MDRVVMRRIVVSDERELVEGDADVEDGLRRELKFLFYRLHGLHWIWTVQSPYRLEEIEKALGRLERESLCLGGPEVGIELEKLSKLGLGFGGCELVHKCIGEAVYEEDVAGGIGRLFRRVGWSEVVDDAIDIVAGGSEKVASF